MSFDETFARLSFSNLVSSILIPLAWYIVTLQRIKYQHSVQRKLALKKKRQYWTLYLLITSQIIQKTIDAARLREPKCNSCFIIATDDYEDSTDELIGRDALQYQLCALCINPNCSHKIASESFNFLNDIVYDGNGQNARRKLIYADVCR